ncbi:hypothetical protein MUGA111182_09690 [Mucilaginibacter galii]|uniref:Uncharacterized protein n=1 Tax=Mucilaginibacter galii TaxID=2005073 RepID=A0A917J8Q3_9SPHI|nr:hypothetical protein [Mucilaginibacter galii]GGI51205.1 hypothetical protein GCM10011425_24170 [Mucilaginibacter galii]
MIKIPIWLRKIWKAIQSLFNHIPEELKVAIHTGVLITENIKTFVDSPVADIITLLIPGETDDRIRVVLRKAIPQILIQLKLADSCSEINNPTELTSCAIKTLQSLTGDLKSAFLHNLSVLIAQVAADGKLTWQDGASIMEWYYQNRFKTN